MLATNWDLARKVAQHDRHPRHVRARPEEARTCAGEGEPDWIHPSEGRLAERGATPDDRANNVQDKVSLIGVTPPTSSALRRRDRNFHSLNLQDDST